MTQYWEFATNEERECLTKSFMNNEYIFSTTYTPVEDQFGSIVQDLHLVEVHYPLYHHYIVHALKNGDLQNRDQIPRGKEGPWYKILAFVTWNHASSVARQHLPRGKFAPAGENPEEYHRTRYPTWDWEDVLESLIDDIVSHHYMEWYYDYCQPRLEKSEDTVKSLRPWS